MNAHIAAITDVKFFDEANGVIVGADDANITRSHAVVIATHDARVATLIPNGVDGQIGFQRLSLERKQLFNV